MDIKYYCDTLFENTYSNDICGDYHFFEFNFSKSYYNLLDALLSNQVLIGNNELQTSLLCLNWVFEKMNYIKLNNKKVSLNSIGILKSTNLKSELFCVHKSIVLNDMLMKNGIYSRLLWCLPKDFDYDCHVVVIAFINKLKKWIFLDPSFGTYFHKDGCILSPIEIRNSYATGDLPSFKNIDISKKWALTLNGIEYSSYDDWYSTYMSKNLFRFCSPKISSPKALEKAINYIFLNPLRYHQKNEYDFKCLNENIYTTSIHCFFESPVVVLTT